MFYALTDAFARSETLDEDLIQAIVNFALAFPDMAISVVFKEQFPDSFQAELEGEGESDEGDEH